MNNFLASTKDTKIPIIINIEAIENSDGKFDRKYANCFEAASVDENNQT